MTFPDPLSAALLSRGVMYGVKGLDRFVPITPEEREEIRRRLSLDGKNMVCTSCGSTKPAGYYDSVQAITCCPARNMVAATDLVAELDRLKTANATLRKRAKRKRQVAA